MRWSFGVLRDHHHLHISGKKSGWCGGPGPEAPPPSVSERGLHNDSFPLKIFEIHVAKYKGNTKEKLRFLVKYKGNTKEKLRIFKQNTKEIQRNC